MIQDVSLVQSSYSRNDHPGSAESIYQKLDQILAAVQNRSLQDLPALTEHNANGNAEGSLLADHSVNGGDAYLVADSNLDDYVLSITTSRPKTKCNNFCRCQCHTVHSYATPRWLRFFFGTLYFGYSGTPLLSRPSCNYVPCQRSRDRVSLFTYRFPGWAVSRALYLAGRINDLSGKGASWTFRWPYVLRDDSPLWSHVWTGSVDQVQVLFDKNVASPFVFDNAGESPLTVSGRFLNKKEDFYILEY